MLKTKMLYLPIIALVASQPVSADSLKPMHAHSIEMSDRTVVVFYTVEGDQYEVTTTIGPHRTEGGPITRYVTRLQQDESYLVSVAHDGSEGPVETLEIRRLGDDLRFHARLEGGQARQAQTR